MVGLYESLDIFAIFRKINVDLNGKFALELFAIIGSILYIVLDTQLCNGGYLCQCYPL